MPAPSRLASLIDTDVVAEAIGGNQLAHAELVLRYQGPVMSFIVRLVQDLEVTADLTQQTFAKAFAALGTYRTERRFAPWIFQIANNEAVSYLRKRGLDTVSIERGGRAVRDQVMGSAISSGDSSQASLRKRKPRAEGGDVQRAIGQLRPVYRQCFLLRHEEHLSYDSIARRLRMPVGTVKSYVHRAQVKLRVALEGKDGE